MQVQKLHYDQIFVDENENARLDYGDIPGLMQYITDNGIPGIITAIQDGAGRVKVIDGFRRMRAIYGLIKAGNTEIAKNIPVLIREFDPEKTDVESLYVQSSTNSGKHFEAYEFGELCRRLETLGQSVTDIAKRTGKSITYINDCLSLAYAPGVITAALKSGEIHTSAAIAVVKNTETRAEAEAVISKAKESTPDGKKINVKAVNSALGDPKPAKATKVSHEKIIEQLHRELGQDWILTFSEVLSGNVGVEVLIHELKNLTSKPL